ncbi:MAG: hypothetical protein PHU85_10490 [Phycisphaerae bacterium]|nr:hypothetical protein [Phycisphaerae bacterium]
MIGRCATLLCVLLLTSAAWGQAAATRESAQFAEPPTVTRDGQSLLIAFATQGECDATVAIVDREDKIVRHLASGVLGKGKNAPPPFERNSLRQKLQWDGKDDAGQPTPPGCRVQVSLGLQAAYDKALGWSAESWALPKVIAGIGCGPDGTLYVYGGEGPARPPRMTALSREGRYLRTVMPYSASLPPEKLKGLRIATQPDGRRTPVFEERRGGMYPQTLFSPRQVMIVSADGKIGFVGGSRERTPAARPTEDDTGHPILVTDRALDLLVIGADGSTPTDSFVGPTIDDTSRPIRPKAKPGRRPPAPRPDPDLSRLDGPACLAVSPDGKTVYAAVGGLLFRMGWTRDEAGVPFGPDTVRARALAVDRDGNLCVSDAVSRPAWPDGRIVVLSPNGALIRSVSTTAPDTLAVHPKTGQFYAFSMRDKRLTKLAPDGARLASLHLPDAALLGRGGTNVVLDASADPPVLWIAHPDRQTRLLRAMDMGDRFGAEPVGPRDAQPWAAESADFLAVDPARDQVYVRRGMNATVRFDGPTGQADTIAWPPQPADRVRTWDRVMEFDIGADGRYYLLWGGNPNFILRYDRQFKPVDFDAAADEKWGQKPFPETAPDPVFSSRPATAAAGRAIALPHRPMNLGDLGSFGFDVAPSGDIYVLRTAVQAARPRKPTTAVEPSPFDVDVPPIPDRPDQTMILDRFGADGRLKATRLVAGLPVTSGGVRVDREGNTYVGAFWPAGPSPHDQIVDQMRADGPLAYTRFFPANWRREGFSVYNTDVGAVLKFAPTGGSVARDGKSGATGLLWSWRGLSPRPAAFGSSNFFGCACQGARFDVDGFGRLFAPDALLCSVQVLDPAGNEVLRIGRYGNPDDLDKSPPRSPVPLWFPACVAVGQDALYISDHAAGRTIRLALSYRAQQAVAVPDR